jgi:hypothetical protein
MDRPESEPMSSSINTDIIYVNWDAIGLLAIQMDACYVQIF